MSATDLTRFDAFVANATNIDATELTIGGFLPAWQIHAKSFAVTFFFGDDGDYQDISVVVLDEV